MKYCDTCEDYQEVENGKCIVCGSKLQSTSTQEEKVILDNWSLLFDEEDTLGEIDYRIEK
jgi:hypothetical protein